MLTDRVNQTLNSKHSLKTIIQMNSMKLNKTQYKARIDKIE
jgi:hypothetical protein